MVSILRRRWALLPLRLLVGTGFTVHGLAKWNRGPDSFAQLLQVIGLPFPVPTAWSVTFLEILADRRLSLAPS